MVVEETKEAAELHARGGKNFRWRCCCQDVVNGDEKVEDSGDADDDPGPGDEDEFLPAPLSSILPPLVVDSKDFFEMETSSTAGREKSTAGVVMGVVRQMRRFDADALRHPGPVKRRHGSARASYGR